jgi:thioredoxin reductase (NADPH)
MEHTKCLIIGGGPAGYTAAIYATRANLSPVLYEGMQPGGQLTTTTEVENFPGYPEGVDGTVLVDDIRRQAVRLGADIRRGIVTKADLSVRPFRVEIDGETSVEAETLIIATGATAKYLGLPSKINSAGWVSRPAPPVTGFSTGRGM